ncbi:MAG: hypothetical protein OWT27_05995 [Firmicutes bacterium]|nr:hypothetical protein [Bacillota bacterium]
MGKALEKDQMEPELLVEQLLESGFRLRDELSWTQLAAVLEAVTDVAALLRDRDRAYEWVDAGLRG